MRRTDYLNGGNWRATATTYMQAHEMIERAITMLCQDPPHPRDYYRNEDFTADNTEWLEHLGALRRAAAYIADESIAISNLEAAVRSTARQNLAMETMVESYKGVDPRGHRRGGAA